MNNMPSSSAYLTDNDFGHLSYFDRFSLAKELTKAYFLTLFVPLLLLGIFIISYGALAISMMSLTPEMLTGTQPYDLNADPGKVLLGSALLLSLFFFILPFLGVGLKNLILHYIYGQEPESVTNAILKPGSRIVFFLICFILWFVINVAYQFFSLVLGAIPVLGFLVTLVATFFYHMVSNCSYSYMADRGLHKGDLTEPVKVISDPLKIVLAYKRVWAAAYLTIFMMFLLPGFLIGAGFSFIKIGGGLFTPGILMAVLGGLGMVLIMIFDLFFMTITYKHTSCRAWSQEAVRPRPVD